MAVDFGEDILRGFKSLDGKIVGEGFRTDKIRLAKDDKSAMVNDIVDKYLNKNLSEHFDYEHLKNLTDKYEITQRDIIREIAKREIQKALGT